MGTIGLDPQATAGKRVVAKGVAECGYDGPVYGCTLGVSSIRPIRKGHEGAERTNGNAAGVSGDTNNANKGGNGSVDTSGGGAVRSGASSAAKVLPSTGGVLPIAGLAGLVIVGAGLVVRGKFAR